MVEGLFMVQVKMKKKWLRGFEINDMIKRKRLKILGKTALTYFTLTIKNIKRL